jgi:hypothetical protein
VLFNNITFSFNFHDGSPVSIFQPTKLDVMANEENEENWDLKLRQDTEQEFFTELALHEAERWIQVSHRES